MESVKLIECPRDAWQGLPEFIPTARKAEYLRALIDAGFRHIDAVSFVSPKAVPQMADSEEVLEQLEVPNECEIIGIVVNEKGAERAIATGKVTTLGFPCSISETFLRRNQNQSLGDNAEMLRQMVARGMPVVAYVSMAFGNPYGDPWSESGLLEAAQRIAATGVQAISLADTVGVADADLIERVVSSIADRIECEFGVHMHSTRAAAVAKVLAAYDAGCRRFDSAIGGLGGCPFAQDEMVGNIPTEEVVGALAQRGVTTPIDLTSLLALTGTIGPAQ
ncbi:MAG: hydroxymethylglutaryl-CoA lyase [Verrucomicrobiota bacterium]|nr:hydroxymethylglutaryl-CoA lyase [Verrucomicrobiota bacterium]